MFNQTIAVASYFYPISSGIYIEDSESDKMVVMNDRP